MTDHRARIRLWWQDQLAAGKPVDLDQAAKEATKQLLADPSFVSALEPLVAPLIRDIGERVVKQKPKNGGEPLVQIGAKVMTRQQAVQLVTQPDERPHWSKLVPSSEGPVWFLAATKPQLLAEAHRRKEAGENRMREAYFLLAVANSLDENQIVGDQWNEKELEQLYQGIDVRHSAKLRPETQLAQGAA